MFENPINDIQKLNLPTFKGHFQSLNSKEITMKKGAENAEKDEMVKKLSEKIRNQA